MVFVIYSWIPLFSRPPPLRLPPSVPLFRVGFVHGFVRLCIGCDWERRPHPPCAGLLNQSNYVPLVLFVMDFRFDFDALDCDVS